MPGAGTRKGVPGSGTAMEGCSFVVDALNFARAQANAHLYTPDLANFREALALDTFPRCQNDLLLGFDVVVLEQPDGGALDKIAIVGRGDLLQQLGDLRLGVRLPRSGLLLLLLCAIGLDEARGQHEPEEQLVRIVGGQEEVCFAAGDLIRGADQDGVANNGREAVNLSTELDLDHLALLERGSGLLGVGLQGGVGGDVRAGGDGSAVADALGNLLALVDLGRLFLQQLVAALTELDNVGIGLDPSCSWSAGLVGGGRGGSNAPATSLRTFSAMVAAVLYLVSVSGFARV